MSRTSPALVLAAIALLAAIRPAATAPLAIHIHSDRAMFQVLISPGTVGTDSFELQLMSGDGNLLRAKEATLFLSLPERGIAPVERQGQPRRRRLLAPVRRADPTTRPVAAAHRRPDGFPEDHVGGDFDVPAR
jgi:hypothetical protein